MFQEIPVNLYGSMETLTVEYKANADPREAGFHLLNLPFPIEDSIGYPVIHAFFADMKATGYKRYCGFIQFIERIEKRDGRIRKALSVDVAPEFRAGRNPFFSYGYPASLFDAPCRNLRDCDELGWTAFTYLVEMPTRINGNQIRHLAGFSWGYAEDRQGLIERQELKLLTPADWKEQYGFLEKWMKCGSDEVNPPT